MASYNILSTVLVVLTGSVAIHGVVLVPDSFGDVEIARVVGLALSRAHAEIKLEKTLNEKLFREGVDTSMGGGNNANGLSHKHMFGMFRNGFYKHSSFSDSERATVFNRATQELTRMLGKSPEELKLNPTLTSIWHAETALYCKPRRPKCKKSLYRTADGSCNNLHHPTWGMANRDQTRFLYPDYDDGVSVPRIHSVTGSLLPSTRLVSNFIHGSGVSDLLEPGHSAMLMQWGQLLSHDFIDSPTIKGDQGATLTCCNLGPKILSKRSACFPIAIPPNDKHFHSSCMNFVRTAPATTDNCQFGVRNQLNAASSYIDASFLYGADKEDMNKIRAFKGGFLKMNKLGFFEPDEDQNKCLRVKPGDYCMKSGDSRIHIVPGQASTQILFLREHNRIAAILGKINPRWNDELIFQETRKIVIGMNQHIAYSEYLPLILGPAHMKEYELYSTPIGHNTVYNPSVDATMANAFGVAAFRFGHSQVPGDVALTNAHHQTMSLRIEETFNRPTTLMFNFGQGCDDVNRWLFKDKGAKSDNFLEPGIRNRLFLDKNGQSFDLAALNIQRGRDHGIPGYNAYRKWCGLPVALHFHAGPGGLVDHHQHSALLLSKVYSHPDDIDLFAGGLSERHVVGGAMGPTFACIVARQFQAMKFGDRFWYENDFHETGLTEAQLNQIKQVRLSRLLCNNMETDVITRNAFLIPSKRNPYVSCRELPDIDFSLWKDLSPIVPNGLFHPPVSPVKHLVLL